MEGTFTSFFKVKKVKKKSQNGRNQGLSYYFCLMIEGSGSGSIPLTNGPDPDPGGPKTRGSGDVHPKLVKYLALEYGVSQNSVQCFFAYIRV